MDKSNHLIELEECRGWDDKTLLRNYKLLLDLDMLHPEPKNEGMTRLIVLYKQEIKGRLLPELPPPLQRMAELHNTGE